MKLFQTAAFLVAAGGSSAWGAADPQLLGLLMPDAKMIAGVQLNQAKASPFGQFVLSQATPAAEFDKLKAATGFDPRTDLTEMVAGATGTNGGLIVGRGAFQPAQLANLAMAAGAPLENYRGIVLIGNGNPEGAPAQDSAVAFLDGTTVLLGDRAAVKAAVDRWISASRSTSALSSKAAEISAASQAWAVATGLSELQGPAAPNAPPEAQMVQNVLAKITQLSGGVSFGDTVSMHAQAQTASAQDAQALADVFQFVLSMAGGKTPLPALPLASANGSALDITLTLTEQQAEELFRPAVAPRAAARQ